MNARRQKALTEQRFEFCQWKRWRRERLEVLLAGPYGEAVQSLLTFCKAAASPSALIDFVKVGPWHTADADVRFQILSLLDAAIMKRREQMHMPAIDDPLPHQPDSAFLLNEASPRSEWGEDYNGNPQGPWQRQRVVHFVDLNTMEKFTWPSGTVGADICVCEFRERVRMMRQFRGARCFAIVTFGDAYMHTKYGGRQRPDLRIVRWITLGVDGGALPSPSARAGAFTSPSAPSPASASAQLDQFAEPAEPQSGIRTVEEPSLSEHMGGDSVPW